jgi:lipopolysaccharide/colanic/teichoic acid biosynthesis glycosyltransferase
MMNTTDVRPKTKSVSSSRVDLVFVNPMPARMIRDGMAPYQRRIKHAVDCVSAFCELIVFSPLFLICYLMVKLEDGGPVIYKQERIGRFGRPFWIYKFRSMKLNAEKNGPALYKRGEDNRLTKIGRILRQHHLDELPQLWNVFRGDMSFVGPRPERKFYIDQIMKEDNRYQDLYQIRPGVTSYATLYNGYTDTMEKMLSRLNFDLYYLEHRSFWLDVKIVVMTFLKIAFGIKF